MWLNKKSRGKVIMEHAWNLFCNILPLLFSIKNETKSIIVLIITVKFCNKILDAKKSAPSFYTDLKKFYPMNKTY
jgi:hypothetical protein